MKIDQLDRVLDGIPGARKEAGSHLIPEEQETSIYISLPAEVLTIARVARVERSADLMTIETYQGDRYHVLVDAVVLVKVAAPARQGGGRGAGFR